jgi:phosphoenolpyruvate phosphomutase
MTFEAKKLPGDRIPLLKNIIEQKGSAVGIEAHSGLSGIVAENLDFDFIWESSLTDSASKGLPDASIVSNESRIHTINEILNVTTKPMIVDGDTGGDEDNFRFLVKRLENLGCSAVIIEDKIYPKRNSFGGTGGGSMENPNIFAKKLKVGIETKSTSNFLIIARLESLIAGLGMLETLNRAEMYIKAGVDGIMIHSKLKNPSEVVDFIPKYEAICKKLGHRPYLIAVPTTYNSILDTELIDAGVNIIIHANHLIRSSYKSMLETGNLILNSGRSLESDGSIASVKDIFKVVGYDKILSRDKENIKKVTAFIPSAGEYSINSTIPRSLEIINGLPLIQHQSEILKKMTIDDINLIVSDVEMFKSIEKLDINLIQSEYSDENNLLKSIMSAEKLMSGNILLLYGDILFNEKIISSIISQDDDIILAVDSSYKHHKHNIEKKLDLVSYKNKKNISNKSLNISQINILEKIGKELDINDVESEFIGIAYFSSRGLKTLKDNYNNLLKSNRKSINLVDIINYISDEGSSISCLEFDGGWIEIHNAKDLEVANKELSN